MSTLPRGRLLRFATALLLLPMAAAPADARAGGGFSFGSRGTRSYSAPAPTQTAPRYAQPFNRIDSLRYGAPPQRRFGFGTGLLAGLLGAGLMGSMFGGGFFGGIAALLGLLIKLALIGGVILLVLRLVRGRSQGPAFVGNGMARSGLDGGLPGSAPMGDAPAPRTGPATVAPEDYAAFEQSLSAIQAAYSREDAGALSRLATPEMVRELGREILANQQRGLRNDISQVRLLQGDLSEAWTEGATTYATVAMRFSAVDVMLERNGNRIVSGDPVQPVEAVELWTFRRDGRGAWILSAIQQAG